MAGLRDMDPVERKVAIEEAFRNLELFEIALRRRIYLDRTFRAGSSEEEPVSGENNK